MKPTKIAMAVALAASTALGAVEVLTTADKPAGCEPLAKIQVGDMFNRHSRDVAWQGVIDEAQKMGAQKVYIELTSQNHQKLGRSYAATGTAYKCGK